ncbi:MAG TPA: hypothetical protein VFV43_09070 [Limnobacter sp.]|nr:hypothetical protein [Limnobacter sp.]
MNPALITFSPDGQVTIHWDAVEEEANKPLKEGEAVNVTVGWCKALMSVKPAATN